MLRRRCRHGRDNKLIVWKLAAEDESAMSTSLPLNPVPETRPQPWLLHLLEVNTMNFCAFAACAPPTDGSGGLGPELSVAVPNTLASEAVCQENAVYERRRLHVY